MSFEFVTVQVAELLGLTRPQVSCILALQELEPRPFKLHNRHQFIPRSQIRKVFPIERRKTTEYSGRPMALSELTSRANFIDNASQPPAWAEDLVRQAFPLGHTKRKVDDVWNQLHSFLADPVGILTATIILSILIGALFFWLGKKTQSKKQPYWAISNTNLIQKTASPLQDLDIKYKGHEVETLSVARVMLWNAGRQAIDGEDISVKNPLKIRSLNDVNILDVQLVGSNHEEAMLRAGVMNDHADSAAIMFDYLNHGWGGVFQVIHTGSQATDIVLDGSIKDVDSIELRNLRRGDRLIFYFNVVMSSIMTLIILVTYLGWFGQHAILDLEHTLNTRIVVLALLCVGGPITYFTSPKKAPHGLGAFVDVGFGGSSQGRMFRAGENVKF